MWNGKLNIGVIALNDTSLYIRSENVKETRMEWVKDTEIRKNSHVVYIDPAKQIYADKKPEALFPDGDAEKVTTGIKFRPSGSTTSLEWSVSCTQPFLSGSASPTQS